MTECYQIRLERRVQQWTDKHPDEAQRLRAAIYTHHGLLRSPDPTSLLALSLESAFQEAVRKKAGWPTEQAYLSNAGR